MHSCSGSRLFICSLVAVVSETVGFIGGYVMLAGSTDDSRSNGKHR